MNNPIMKSQMPDHEVLELIRSAYCHAKPDMAHKRASVTLDASVESLGIQSVAALEMAGFIEEQLDVQFADDELSTMNGIADLAALVQRYHSPAVVNSGYALGENKT